MIPALSLDLLFVATECTRCGATCRAGELCAHDELEHMMCLDCARGELEREPLGHDIFCGCPACDGDIADELPPLTHVVGVSP